MKTAFFITFATHGYGHFRPMLSLCQNMDSSWKKVFFCDFEEASQKLLKDSKVEWQGFSEDFSWSWRKSASECASRVLRMEIQGECDQVPLWCVIASFEIVPFLLRKIAELKPSVIVYDAMCPAGKIVGHVTKIPCLCLMTAHPDVQVPLSETVNHFVQTALETLNQTYNLQLSSSMVSKFYSERNALLVEKSWTSGHFAEDSFFFVGPSAVLYNSETVIEKRDFVKKIETWKRRDCKLVYVGLGTVVPGIPFFRRDVTRLLQACIGLTNEEFVVCLSGQNVLRLDGNGKLLLCDEVVAECIDDEKIFLENWVPQAEFLASGAVDVMITHGGMNSLGEALHAGVPTVITPFFDDQFTNAEWASNQKVAVFLNRKDLTNESLLASAKTALNLDISRARMQSKRDAEKVVKKLIQWAQKPSKDKIL